MLVWTFSEGEGEAARKVDSLVVPLLSSHKIYINVHRRTIFVKRRNEYIYFSLSLHESEKS